MAVTKIHPIKSTLKKALDYIENPAKTDEKMLVSSFACSYETADIEFELLLSQAMQKGNNLAHHLIQSFAPGETTPEQAHEIGRQLADEVLQGKYPYVLTTHIDKGHVHNHVIFCAVDMVNQRKVCFQPTELCLHPAHQRPAVQGTWSVCGDARSRPGQKLCRVGCTPQGYELEGEAERSP